MSQDSSAYQQSMLPLARRLALDAAQMALDARLHTEDYLKEDTSVVTQADHDVQEMILSQVGRSFPDHATIGEEATPREAGAPNPSEAQFCWVVDPIDGTRNYVAGFPCFATSIGILEWGRPVVGVIVEHNLQHIYTAVRGGGAALDDRPISVERPRGDLLVAVPSSKDRLTVAVQRDWCGRKGVVCRNTGSAAVHLGMVAAGQLDGAFARRCKIWDIAAGALIVTEAGGWFTDPRGNPLDRFDLTADPESNIPFLAGSPEAHAFLQPTVQEAIDGLSG